MQAQAPGIRLSQGFAVVRRCRDIRAHIPDHRGPQAPLGATPPLARELEARVAVTGKTWGLGGQLTFSDWHRVNNIGDPGRGISHIFH